MSSKYQKAFTILELTVSLSLIVIIITLTIANYKRGNSRTALILGTYQVASDLRQAESYAASARQFGGASDSSWGIYFDQTKTNQYLMFVDANGTGKYDNGDKIYKTVKLPRGIEFKEARNVAVIYSPPDPSVTIDINPAPPVVPATSTLIKITDTTNFTTGTVFVNAAGLVDIR